MVAGKPFGPTFLDVSVAVYAQVSYLTWLGGQQDGKQHVNIMVFNGDRLCRGTIQRRGTVSTHSDH